MMSVRPSPVHQSIFAGLKSAVALSLPLYLFTCPGKSATCAISSLGWAAVSRCSLLFFYGGRGNCLPHHRQTRWLLYLLALPVSWRFRRKKCGGAELEEETRLANSRHRQKRGRASSELSLSPFPPPCHRRDWTVQFGRFVVAFVGRAAG